MPLKDQIEGIYHKDHKSYQKIIDQAVENVDLEKLEDFLLAELSSNIDQLIDDYQREHPSENQMNQWKQDQQYQQSQWQTQAL